MPTLQELTERVRGAAAGSAQTRPVTLDLGDTGLIHLEGGVVGHDDGPADCRITLSADNLEALMDGRLDPTTAYMTGDLAVSGDMGLALQLAASLR